jgi:hypothetical protein
VKQVQPCLHDSIFSPNLPSHSLCQRPKVLPPPIVIGSIESKAEDRRVYPSTVDCMPAYERITAIRPGVSFETWLRGCPQVSRLLVVRLWLHVWARYLILWLDLEVLIGRATVHIVWYEKYAMNCRNTACP